MLDNGVARGAADGLRERNKRDKLERILAAAREAFGRDGYEATTLRQVAAAAGVAVGTVFLYAATKEDLLILVFRRELEPVVDRTFIEVPKTNIVKQILFIFDGIVQHHSENLRLSRPFLRDMMFVTGKQAVDISQFMLGWRARIVGLLEDAKSRGELIPSADSDLLALCSLNLFLSALRQWVAGHAARKTFDETLPAMLGALFTGFLLPAVPAKTSKAGPRRSA